MKNNVLNTIGAVLVTIGAVLVTIGTVGSMELDRITFTRAIVQCLIGLGVAVLGGRLFSATYNNGTYYYEEEEEENDYE